MRAGLMLLLNFVSLLAGTAFVSAQEYEAELIFPLDARHNHAPGIVQFDNGDLFVTWYRGSGERKADDVAVMGAWRRAGQTEWSEPRVVADQPDFPDCNTCLYLSPDKKLWLFWPTVIANSWESCLTRYRTATDFTGTDAPRWTGEGLVLLKPDDFSQQMEAELQRQLADVPRPLPEWLEQELAEARTRLGEKLYQRLGWQPRCKPTRLRTGRLLLPLYTDTFSISIMAISDDEGQTWRASKPLIGLGNIQPTVLERRDGSLVAYMRENGLSGRVRVSESQDAGESWGEVTSSSLLNPGSGLDGVRLSDGRWVLVYNDTEDGRNRLAISVSDDEGATWKWNRHLEHSETGSYHYPAVIEGSDGLLHVVYSYFVEGGKSMKHVQLSPDWMMSGK